MHQHLLSDRVKRGRGLKNKSDAVVYLTEAFQSAKAKHCWQDLNQCGETPMEFQSIASTTQPKQPNESDFISHYQEDEHTLMHTT